MKLFVGKLGTRGGEGEKGRRGDKDLNRDDGVTSEARVHPVF